MIRRSTLMRSSTSAPSASSIALKALVMYATGQIPQIRAVMSGASANERPRRKASKKRGGS
jgi:hypothetical protein